MTSLAPRYTASATLQGSAGGPLLLGAQPSAGLTAQLAPFFVGAQGEQGQPGPPGPAGDGLFEFTATSAIGGHRMLATNAAGQIVYATNTEPMHAHTLLGLSTHAAAAGATLAVLQAGPIAEPSWAWAPGLPLFLGASGLLTQTPPAPPAAAFSLVVGFALSATEIFLTPRDPIHLGD